jgi:hypothetical protein
MGSEERKFRTDGAPGAVTFRSREKFEELEDLLEEKPRRDARPI